MAEKYGVISSLEPLKKGDTFEVFPLHVTLMTWFDIPNEAVFLNQLYNFAHRFSSQNVVGGQEAQFGVNNDVRVRTLGRAGSLHAMHEELFDMIKTQNGEVWHGGFVGADYVPHVTYQNNRGLEQDEAANLDRIQLIRGDETGPRLVVADLGLRKKSRTVSNHETTT